LTLIFSLLILSMVAKVAQNNGHATRITQMLDRINEIMSVKTDNLMISEKRISGDHLQMKNVVCATPTGKVLTQHGISVKVKPNEALILMGPSGCGKSSLLRILSGLWPLSQGTVILPQNILFLPQKPYMVIGTLRDQIIYPKTVGDIDISDDDLQMCLQKARLGYLLNRFTFDSQEIWSSVLSSGEQQRLSLARLFYHSPSFAVLDESTSALDPENEDTMYEICKELGIGLVSVAHRESLIEHHNILLKFDGKGGWELLKKVK